MILRLLRFFNHSLLAQLERGEREQAILQDRLERADQDRERLREDNRHLLQKLTTYFEMDKNVEWQGFGRPAPFPDSPHLPPRMVHEPDDTPQRGERSQGSQLVIAQHDRFREETLIRFGLKEAS